MKPKEAFPPEDAFDVEEETAAEAAADAAASPLASAIPPHGLSEDQQAQWWLKNVYQAGWMRQLTVRSVVAGMLIGALMATSNLYVGLKTGWGLGVTVTACVLAFAVFKSLETILPWLRKHPLGMLENCSLLTTASAAGAISSAGLVSAIPALYLCTGQPMGIWQMMAWLVSVATLGLCMAVPLKRQLINIDQLPFPSGIATAETLKSLHSTGVKAMQQAKTLLFCGLFGALLKFMVEGWADVMTWLGGKVALAKGLAGYAIPDEFPFFPGEKGRLLLDRYTFGFEGSTIMLAIGAIMGIRVGVSMLLGVVVFYGILAPTLDHYALITFDPADPPLRSITTWTLWPAVALMVAAGLTNFALRWRMIVRALGGLTAIFGKRSGRRGAADGLEVPTSWFIIGCGISGLACVWIGASFFQISIQMGILAVLLTFVLSMVAARATGETDITPIGAMGKITQLTYGILVPRNMATNLMTAGITAGAATHSADLLTALKTGYLVGANPRKQAIAQLFGVLMGVLICVPVYAIIVRTPPFVPKHKAAISQQAPAKPAAEATAGTSHGPAKRVDDPNKTNLVSDQFPAPSVVVWSKVAEILAEGVQNLPKGTVIAMIFGGVLGIGIALLEEFLPKHCLKWIPSATGLGLAGVITAHNSIAMFLGAFIAWIWTKSHSRSAGDYIIPGASGLIAGESLTGVTMNLCKAAPAIGPAIWHTLRSFFGG